jgi:hypothetical protein
MRRSFAVTVLPLALVALVPALLIGRAGPHDHAQPPWGIDAARLQTLQRSGAALGLRAGSVFVAEVGAGPADDAPILLEGKTPSGRTCAFVVRGTAAGALRCLDVLVRARPAWALAYRPGRRGGIAVVGILRSDVQRIALVGRDGRLTGAVILEPGHVFNLGGPGESLRLRLYGRANRVLGDVQLRV